MGYWPRSDEYKNFVQNYAAGKWLDNNERYQELQDKVLHLNQLTSKATPHNYRLAPLPHACLHLFRHIAQFVLARRQPCVVLVVQSDEKSDYAIIRQ
mgnify:CR=1 FL=1